MLMSERLPMFARFRRHLSGLARPFFLGISLVMLALSVVLMADVLELREDPKALAQESRKVVIESIAVQLSTLASLSEAPIIEDAVAGFIHRNNEVKAVSLIRDNGIVITKVGETQLFDDEGLVTSDTYFNVPIYNGSQSWGELKVIFNEFDSRWKDVLWFGFVSLSSLAAFTTFLGRALVQLDPNRAVPGRVESAMNLFSAGVFVLDAKQRIVMANTSAIALVEPEATELIGKQLEDWNWKTGEGWQAPWKTTLNSGLAVSDQPLTLISHDGTERSLLVSCAFVGDAGRKGVLVTLDDMTMVERQNSELTTMLAQLQESQDVITAQNHELMLLATTDPLTGIANRRTLMERLTENFVSAKRDDLSLSCIMTDIDHFKQVNDNYGHGVGDDVIKAVGAVLQPLCRDVDIVGRYGGEEFVVILPGMDAAEAAEVAEIARQAVFALAEGDQLAIPRLSSSFGVADMTSSPADGDALVDNADQALYAAKQGGRNQVSIYDPAGPVLEEPPREEAPKPDKKEDAQGQRIVALEKILKLREDELAVLRELDPHTGVPLRTIFLKRLDEELSRSSRNDSIIGVMSLGIRDLNGLIEAYGNDVVDELVRSVLLRLHEAFRNTDLVSTVEMSGSAVSRITLNEYGVVLASLAEPSDAMVVIARIKRLLSEPIQLNDIEFEAGINIGIALSTIDTVNSDELFTSACDARQKASLNPDNISHVFAGSQLQAESVAYLDLETDLFQALTDGNIETWFQPKFDIQARRVTGIEALLRWNHESKGFIPPPIFIAVAEANGLMGKLSEVVLFEALAHIRRWHDMGFTDLRVSVNVSPMQLRAESLVSETFKALERAGVSGKHLEIELTESFLFDNPEQSREALSKLRAQGVEISLDDFGTGYTSLSTLAAIPLDTVKIDRVFISRLVESPKAQTMVGSLINMAHGLKLRVVGEGVETNEQLEIMSRLGCDEAQGFLISHPQSADKITQFLVHQKSTEAARRA